MYFISLVANGRVMYRICNEANGKAWRRLLSRRGYSAALVHIDLGAEVARREAMVEAELQERLHQLAVERAARRQVRKATGWKPYLRGRFPQWVGLLAGFPLPGERAAR